MALHQNEWAQGMNLDQDIELIAAADHDPGAVGYIDSSGRFALAIASGTSTIPAVLCAVNAASASKMGTYRPWGVVVYDSWSWTAGNPLYVSSSTAGSLTASAPSTYIQPVAIALSTTAILLFPAPQADYSPFYFADGENIVLGTSTGSKIGTATNQKLGFFNATPVTQQANTTDLKDMLITFGFRASGGASPLNLDGGAATVGALTATSIVGTGDAAITGHATFTDAKNIVLQSTTGTKIGTATNQKIGFYNATPVDQAANTEDLKDVMVALGLIATGGATPLNLDSGTLTAGTVAATDLTLANDATITDAGNFIFASTTGTKFGTATNQKIGFFNATPVDQAANTEDLKDVLVALGFIATGGATPLNLDSGTLTGGTVAATDITLANDMTITDAGNIILATNTGTLFGTATNQKLGFYNTTPVVQRSGASQAQVTTTAATSTSPWGFSTSTQADGVITLLNEIQATLAGLGIFKGAA